MKMEMKMNMNMKKNKQTERWDDFWTNLLRKSFFWFCLFYVYTCFLEYLVGYLSRILLFLTPPSYLEKSKNEYSWGVGFVLLRAPMHLCRVSACILWVKGGYIKSAYQEYIDHFYINI